MNSWGRVAIVAAIGLAGAASAAEHHGGAGRAGAAAAKPSPRPSAAVSEGEGGPVAVYWMSAQTSTGFMAGMMGGNGKMDRGAMMGMMMRGGPDPNAVNHTLRLQLGSTRRPDGPPRAEHDPSNALNSGPLPLVTPVAQPSQPVEEEPRPPEQYQKPQGKILIFWGCGEHAGPNQPYVVDFATMQNNPQAMAGLMRGMAVSAMQPPSPSRFTTYGEWPNDQSRATIPRNGSLVGDHTVRGDYSPDIHFNLTPNQDFMAPLRLVTNARTRSGAVQLAWTPAPTALGYFATAMGGGDGGRGGATAVMWTSSATQAFAFGMPEYLAPGETRRLVADGHLLAPSQTQCAVSQEAVQAMGRGGIVMLSGYGEEANFAWPLRPQRPAWTVKVRYRTTTSGMLGQADPMGGGGRRGDDDGEGGGQQQQQHGGFMHGLGGLGGFIP